MKSFPSFSLRSMLQPFNVLVPRSLGGKDAAARVQEGAASYVGLFQGTIETAQSSAAPVPAVPAGPGSRPVGSASGFLRLQVDQKKKATGCFMFFVDGEVLTGAVEGASESTDRFVNASFRLDADSARKRDGARRAPIAAVGRLQLQDSNHQRAVLGNMAANEGEELTIRFV